MSSFGVFGSYKCTSRRIALDCGLETLEFFGLALVVRTACNLTLS